MSFVKIPHARPSTKGCTKGSTSRSRRKPQWDSTLTDLEVYKSSPDELVRRKTSAASKNIDAVKEEKFKKKIRKAQKPCSNQKRSRNLLREVLFDNSQMQETLTKSDKMMAVVKDIFGDDPKKFIGLPNVTMAPDPSQHTGHLPDGSAIRGPSELDILSQSVMDRTALNDLASENSIESENEEELAYKPVMDFRHFRDFLEEAAADEMSNPYNKGPEVKSKGTKPGKKSKMRGTAEGWEVSENTPEGSPLRSGDAALSLAINDTQKIQRHLSHTQDVEQQQVEHPDQDDLVQINQVLNGVKKKDGDSSILRSQTDSNDHGEPGNKAQQMAAVDYSVTLVDAVSNLATHLRANELRLTEECALQEQLREQMTNLNAVVHGLTRNLLATQQELLSLKSEYSVYQGSVAHQVEILTEALRNGGLDIPAFNVRTVQPNSELSKLPKEHSTLETSHISTVPTRVHAAAHDKLHSAVHDLDEHATFMPPRPAFQAQHTEIDKESLVSTDELADQMSQALTTQLNSLAPASQSAFQLCAPLQTNSPSVPGGKYKSRLDHLRNGVTPGDEVEQQGVQNTHHDIKQSNNHRATVDVTASQTDIMPNTQHVNHVGRSSLETGRNDLMKQLEELSRQQSLAEDKLTSLLEYKLGHSNPHLSPSISPITCPSDMESMLMTQISATQDNTSIVQARQPFPRPTKEIHVAMPRVVMANAQKNGDRVHNDSSIPMTPGGWFALSSHTNKTTTSSS